METLYKIGTATQWKGYLRDSEGILYESRELADAKRIELERLARNEGSPQVLFRIEEIDLASEAAKAMGRKGGTVTSERKAEAARTNGETPKRRGRPPKVESITPPLSPSADL
jgi:hypothetical protein